MEITINVPEPLAHYADKHQTSVDELTTEFWQALLQENTSNPAHRAEIRRRLAAYDAGETESMSLEEFKQKMRQDRQRV